MQLRSRPEALLGSAAEHSFEDGSQSHELLQVGRLAEVPARTQPQGILPILWRTGGGEDPDRGMTALHTEPDAFQDLPSSSFRKIQVDQNQVGANTRLSFDKLDKLDRLLAIV